jgi:hypothetical protein
VIGGAHWAYNLPYIKDSVDDDFLERARKKGPSGLQDLVDIKGVPLFDLQLL